MTLLLVITIVCFLCSSSQLTVQHILQFVADHQRIRLKWHETPEISQARGGRQTLAPKPKRTRCNLNWRPAMLSACLTHARPRPCLPLRTILHARYSHSPAGSHRLSNMLLQTCFHTHRGPLHRLEAPDRFSPSLSSVRGCIRHGKSTGCFCLKHSSKAEICMVPGLQHTRCTGVGAHLQA